MLAVVTLRPGEPGRHYRLPTERDYEAVRKPHASRSLSEWRDCDDSESASGAG